MDDTWTKSLGFGRGKVTYTTTGEVGTGFVHTAKYERSTISETTHSKGDRELTREEVEELFEDFVSRIDKKRKRNIWWDRRKSSRCEYRVLENY